LATRQAGIGRRYTARRRHCYAVGTRSSYRLCCDRKAASPNLLIGKQGDRSPSGKHGGKIVRAIAIFQFELRSIQTSLREIPCLRLTSIVASHTVFEHSRGKHATPHQCDEEDQHHSPHQNTAALGTSAPPPGCTGHVALL